ncbi:MAG: NADH-quinone oxidoreductase subunit NuoK [Bacteroidetes bacterium]|nr:MAG: NADH-quinone oxidoreductase subunit NuoK [Bacteroidota bacterium]
MHYYFIISVFLFCLGLYFSITAKNFILVLIGIELILNATNLNLVAFDVLNQNSEGKMASLFVILVAACETAVALAIILNVYRYIKTMNPEQV